MIKKPERHVLSKSTFIRGCQCAKSLFLYKHQPELRDEISDHQQAIFNRGTSVGELAQQLFPGGIDASPATPFEYQKSVAYTQQLIEDGQKIIYEAAFQFNGVLAAIDILVKTKGKWKAYEVKSSTQVKDTFILDASLQYHVITQSGIALEDISIVHINNQYVRKGKIDINQLFAIQSINEEVLANQDFVAGKIAELKDVIKLKEAPVIDIGAHCGDPYPCDFTGHCWQHVPENSVFDISRLNGEKKFDLYSRGIVRFEDITEDVVLNDNQQLQVTSYLNKTDHIDKEGIREFLKNISHPIYFLDFETFMPAIPLYDQSRPYQQIPFQYSLHYKKKRTSEAQHFEFLAFPDGDPRIPFIEQLLKETKAPGDILTYNQAFEKTRLKELAADFPKYANDLEERISRIKDLMTPFMQKLYYRPSMNGSYSIKSVLPALIPELSYDDLAIGNGGDASVSFEQMIYDKVNDHSELRNNLLEYCKLDTFAMVKILEHLENL